MRISDWSSDVCSSDLRFGDHHRQLVARHLAGAPAIGVPDDGDEADHGGQRGHDGHEIAAAAQVGCQLGSVLGESLAAAVAQADLLAPLPFVVVAVARSDEHTPELPSLMRLSYAVFCLQKHNKTHTNQQLHTH